MKTTSYSVFPWMLLAGVMLAALVGLAVVFFLNIGSGGILATLIAVAVLFVLFGSIHYVFWGRTLSPVKNNQVKMWDQALADETINVELTESERLELVQLLEQSKTSPNLANENLLAAEDKKQQSVQAARREELLQKLRMFGG